MKVIGLKTVQSRKRVGKKTNDVKKATTAKQNNKGNHVVNIAFRKLDPTDLKWVVELTQKELGSIYQTAYQEPLAPYQVEQLVNTAQQASVILCNDEPVGYYTYFSDLSRKRHVSSLVIDKSKQRNGIGTKVMQLIEEQAKKDGIQVLEVFIQANNQPCLAFIEKQGYQKIQSPYFNTVCYQKVLK
jgi:ribosomal protein S18 acetylase RimI-like enzyme